MYIQMLDPDSRELFAQATLRMIKRDKVDSSEEGELVTNLLVECELDEIPEPLTMPQILKQLPKTFSSEVHRRIVLLELAGVVEIDGDSSEEELQMLEKVAEVLDLSGAQIQRSLEFARKMRALTVEGNFLIASEVEA